MKLKSFGCSFIFGSELADDGYVTNNGTPSQSTWPAHLAQYLGADYKCYANPGSGNLRIAESILTQASDVDSAVFVIGWTWIDRFDYVDTENDQWKTVLPNDHSREGKFYYKILDSELRDKLVSLMYIKLVIDTLTEKKIPFIMTCMDNLLFEQRWHATPAINELQDQIRPYITTFDGMNFLDWSRKNNYAVSTKWHPLETAHRAAGYYMIKVFDKQNIIGR